MSLTLLKTDGLPSATEPTADSVPEVSPTDALRRRLERIFAQVTKEAADTAASSPPRHKENTLKKKPTTRKARKVTTSAVIDAVLDEAEKKTTRAACMKKHGLAAGTVVAICKGDHKVMTRAQRDRADTIANRDVRQIISKTKQAISKAKPYTLDQFQQDTQRADGKGIDPHQVVDEIWTDRVARANKHTDTGGLQTYIRETYEGRIEALEADNRELRNEILRLRMREMQHG